MKKVLLNEDTPDEVVDGYIKRGFKPYFLSKRKIRKKDKRVWNKIRRWNLDPEVHIQFGKVDPGKWDVIDFGDPILDKLLLMGGQVKGKVIKSFRVDSSDDLKSVNDYIDNIDLRFVKVSVRWRYALRDDVPAAIEGSRPFCQKLMSSGRTWTTDEIKSLDNGMPGDIGDVFLYRGGFYRNPDTGETTPFCRHQWVAEVVVS